MHEFNIIQNIFPALEKIANENHLKSIEKVTLQVGKLRQIVPETLQFAFKTLAINTLAHSAELIIEEIPISFSCTSCQKTFIVEDHIYICPFCESLELKIVSGKEIILASVDGK